MQIPGPTVRLKSSSIPPINVLTLVGLGSSVCRRENARRRWVSAAARLTEVIATSM